MFFLRKLSFLMLVLSAFLLAACDQGQQSSASSPRVATGAVIGSPAPDFTLVDRQGRKVTLSELHGKVVIVNFWATWCPPCREEMPSMDQFYRRFKDQGVELLAVNVDEDGGKAVDRFMQGKDYTFPILLDTAAEVQNSYQVFRFPETFVIDSNGIIVDKIIGGRNWMSDTLVMRINFLVNG